MKHFSLFKHWFETVRQLRLALLGLAVLFATLVLSTLDLTVRLNHYTIRSSRDSLLNTSKSSVFVLKSYLDQQMSYVQRAATAIAGLPQGDEAQVQQLLNEYFQRSDFTQMWAVSLDNTALSAQGEKLTELSDFDFLSRAFSAQSGYSPVYTSAIYHEDQFYLYVPVQVSPEQPVSGAVLGILSCKTLEQAVHLYGLSEESCLAVFQPNGALIYACEHLKQQMQPGHTFWDTPSGRNLTELPREGQPVFGTGTNGQDKVAYLCVSTRIEDWYFYQDVPQSTLLATNTQEMHLMLLMAVKVLAASMLMMVLLAIYHHQRESQVRRAEDSLRTTNQSLQLALQHTAISLFVYDMATHTIAPNAEGGPSQLSHQSMTLQSVVDRELVAPQHTEMFLDLFRRICDSRDTVQGDFLLRADETSEFLWNRVTLTAVHTPGSQPSRAIVTLEDISEERRREAELRRRAYRDPLTGLYNRQGLQARMKKLISQTPPPSRAAVLMMDLDHFKAVNDTLGHPVGDTLLLHMAKLLERLVPDPAIRVRLGGDEFLILIPEADWLQAEQLATRICAQVPALAGELNLDLPVGTSIGIHLFDPSAESLEQAYQKVDVALYAAKRERGRWVATHNLESL